VHKAPHRHRRFHKARRHSRNGESEESTDKKDTVALPKKNSKHHIKKKIDTLVDENRRLTVKLEHSDINPGKFTNNIIIIIQTLFY